MKFNNIASLNISTIIDSEVHLDSLETVQKLCKTQYGNEFIADAIGNIVDSLKEVKCLFAAIDSDRNDLGLNSVIEAIEKHQSDEGTSEEVTVAIDEFMKKLESSNECTPKSDSEVDGY